MAKVGMPPSALLAPPPRPSSAALRSVFDARPRGCTVVVPLPSGVAEPEPPRGSPGGGTAPPLRFSPARRRWPASSEGLRSARSARRSGAEVPGPAQAAPPCSARPRRRAPPGGSWSGRSTWSAHAPASAMARARGGGKCAELLPWPAGLVLAAAGSCCESAPRLLGTRTRTAGTARHKGAAEGAAAAAYCAPRAGRAGR
ncbi:skin secretory protein xP2-like [Panicum virgatum]|uniref:skin secretory protein xP2-like n=1 Tax=Panicum virgatum TaxID=38727 RepID=UPI0019D6A4FB|nr:skin secretory protein xP2-like [Panicum virgatum]